MQAAMSGEAVSWKGAEVRPLLLTDKAVLCYSDLIHCKQN